MESNNNSAKISIGDLDSNDIYLKSVNESIYGENSTFVPVINPENNNKYQVIEQSMVWSEAKAYCEKLGGHLVTVTSQEEQDFVQDLISTGSKAYYWIGGYQPEGSKEPDGNWTWVTGEKFDDTYTNWHEIEPDNARNDNRALMVRDIDWMNKPNPGKWSDCIDEGYLDILTFGFVCEWKGEQLPIGTPIPTVTPTENIEDIESKELYVEIIDNEKINLKWNAIENYEEYEVYKNGTKVCTIEECEYIDTDLTEGDTYSYFVKYVNADKEPIISDNFIVILGTTTISNNLTLVQNTVYQDVYFNSGTIELKGNTLSVCGNLIQSGGVMNISGGKLLVKGDYRIETKSGGNSNGSLKMVKEEDYVRVGGNFVTKSLTKHNGLLTAGTLEIKGNFEQKEAYSGRATTDNFKATGTHRVILSGDGLQEVSFQNPSNSNFANLVIRNNSSEGVKFATSIGLWVLSEDSIVNSDLLMTGEKIDLNGHKLTINGKLIQEDGEININGGELLIKGDYKIEAKNGGNSNGSLKMVKEEDYVRVDGNFITKSLTKHNGLLTAGTLEIKGNFEQKKHIVEELQQITSKQQELIE